MNQISVTSAKSQIEDNTSFGIPTKEGFVYSSVAQ